MDLTLFKDALVSLGRNRTRTLLTGAAVAGGVFILMISIAGFNIFYNGILGEVSRFSKEVVVVNTLPTTKGCSGFGAGRSWDFNKSDIDEVLALFPDIVTSIGPVYYFQNPQLVHSGNGNRESVTVIATHPEVFGLMQLSMEKGRFIDRLDMLCNRKNCVIGLDLSKKWFGDTDPCGRDILVGNTMYTVVGVVKKDNPFAQPVGNEQKSVLIPYSTADAVYGLDGNISFLVFSLNMTEGFEQRREDVLCFLRQLHRVAPDDTFATNVQSVSEYSQMLEVLFSGTWVLVWVIFIGIILSSLLGVFGIMLLSVRERLRKSAELSYSQGEISTDRLLSRIDEEFQARLNVRIHEIESLRESYKLREE